MLRLTLAVFLALYLVHAHISALDRRLEGCADGEVIDVRVDVLEVQPSSPFHHVTVNAPLELPGCVSGMRRLRLSWPQVEAQAEGGPRVGEVWHLEAKIRSPWSLANPGGFDYERWLLSAGLDGTGYVRRAELEQAAAVSGIEKWRVRTGERLLSAPDQGALLLALGLADTRAITDEVWQLLRRSGTVHLLVVSGLHVGIASMLGYLCIAALLRSVPGFAARLPVRPFAMIGGAASAAGYTAICGFAVPMLRALALCSLAAAYFLISRRLGAWTAWSVALAAVVIVFPLAPLGSGFWLSFGAVAVLLVQFGAVRRPPERLRSVKNLFRAQLGLQIGMLPLIGAVTGQWAALAPLANFLAVPVVSTLVVPPLLANLATGVPLFLRLADGAADLVLRWLHLLPWPLVELSDRPAWHWLVAFLSALLILLPVGWRVRLALLPAVLFVLVPIGRRMDPGSFRLTVLDVGQGSAALVETRNHQLLFDAGARYPSGFDLGARAVLPAVARSPLHRVDHLVESHPDNDHSGGSGAVLAAFPDAWRWTYDGTVGASCHHASPWRWDGVHFRFITSKHIRRAASENDRSCTLLVETDGRSVLLTGDTGRRYEPQIARSVAGAVDVLVAPHHGSATSSSRTFVRRLAPKWVVFSAGRGNRYGHPDERVVERYAGVGSRMLTTHQTGAIIWRSDEPDHVVLWREQGRRYWTRRESM